MAETITVAQFDDRVKKLVSSDDGLCDIYVVGEISEWKTASSGHVYLTLKDGAAILKAIVWRSSVPNIGFKPAIGMKVKAFGSADFYTPGCQLSFVIRNMAVFGEGEQKKALEELTARLLKEGLFDKDRKRALPKYPRTIGVVTSETGAVIRDIIRTSGMQFPADILLAPARVQGDGADAAIIRGIGLLNRAGVDVIIIGRGGGSTEDLSAFNSEALVRAVAESKAPVISAVGHETDKTLADRVADEYASTPTQAAVKAAASMAVVLAEIEGLEKRIAKSMEHSRDGSRNRLLRIETALESNSPAKRIERMGSDLEKASIRMESAADRHVASARASFERADAMLKPSNAARMVNELEMRLDSISESLDRTACEAVRTRRQKLDATCMRLDADNPHNVLKRGYSYISDDSGNTITSAASLAEGARIIVKMRDGKASARIEKVKMR